MSETSRCETCSKPLDFLRGHYISLVEYLVQLDEDDPDADVDVALCSLDCLCTFALAIEGEQAAAKR